MKIFQRIEFYALHKAQANKQSQELKKRIENARKDPSRLVVICDFKEYYQ